MKRSASFTIACIVCSMMTMVTPSRLHAPDDVQHVDKLVMPEAGQRLVEQGKPRARRQRAGKLHEA